MMQIVAEGLEAELGWRKDMRTRTHRTTRMDAQRVLKRRVIALTGWARCVKKSFEAVFLE